MDFKDVPKKELNRAINKTYGKLPFLFRHIMKPLWIYVALAGATAGAYLAPYITKFLGKEGFTGRVMAFFIGGSIGASIGGFLRRKLMLMLFGGRIRDALQSEE